jgi:hypothetical protein
VLQTTAGKMIFCRWPEAAVFPESADTRRDARPVERRDGRNGREFRTGEIRRSDVDRERRDSGERTLPAGLMEATDSGSGSESRPVETTLASVPAPPVADPLVPPPASPGESPAAKAD